MVHKETGRWVWYELIQQMIGTSRKDLVKTVMNHLDSIKGRKFPDWLSSYSC
jgi:hypothetical protein